MTNERLLKAKKNKKDECYTRKQDIEREVQHYNYNGMSVYSPCDDMAFSQFVAVFMENFERFGLTKYCCTNYDNGNGAYKFEYDGHNAIITKLNGDGDFRSEECTKIRDEYDAIVTNPPFSKAKEFIPWAAEKKFLIVANHNSITDKDVFPLLRDKKMWVGASSSNSGMLFYIPDDYEEFNKLDDDGRKMIKVPEACWLTNMENGVCRSVSTLNEQYNSVDYPKYDSFDAIEVSKVCLIPCDYDDLMGVPVSFIYSHNPEQFEILECGSFPVNGKNTYQRLIIGRRKTKTEANGKEKQCKPAVRIFFGNLNYQFVNNPDFRIGNAEHIPRPMPIEHLYLRGSPMLSPIKKEAA